MDKKRVNEIAKNIATNFSYEELIKNNMKEYYINVREYLSMIKDKRAVLILSGGMDSTTLLYELINLGFDVRCISFDYGQKHKKEIEMAVETCNKLDISHRIINLSVLNDVAPSSLTREDWNVPDGHYADENMKQTVVPNRNMVMLSLATSYAISEKIPYLFYGAHSGDHDIYPDCRKEFIMKLDEAIELCDWFNVELIVPFLDIDKGDIARLGKELKVDYSLTWTCYKGKEKACGKCGSCTERLEAFKKVEMKDPIEYEIISTICPKCKFTEDINVFDIIRQRTSMDTFKGSTEEFVTFICPVCSEEFEIQL